MLATLTAEDFLPHVGSGFAPAGAGQAPLALCAVTPSRHRPPQGRQGFSLLFLGPTDTPLAQGTHVLRHTALGELALFLVPLGPQASGMQYEAIFN